ncbi:MAG: TauD/TfdA family dioxygenase [Acidimicrobiales bacterium]
MPGAQNPDRELLGHVKDYGEASTSPLVRLYRTTGDIAFHCDAADVVGLLCLRAAQEGGQSRISSSVAVFNEFLRHDPDLVSELFEPFAIDRRDEQRPGQSPTFSIAPCAWDGEVLRTFWHSDYMRSASDTMASRSAIDGDVRSRSTTSWQT